MRAEERRGEPASEHVGDGAGPERLRGGIRGGHAVEALGRRVDTGDAGAEAEQREAAEQEAEGGDERAEGSGGGSGEKPRAPTEALHRGRERRGREHRAGDDAGDRQGGEAKVRREHLSREAAGDGVNRQLGAEDGRGRRENRDVPSRTGVGIGRGGPVVVHDPFAYAGQGSGASVCRLRDRLRLAIASSGCGA